MTPLANSQPVSFGYNFSNSVDVKQLNLEPEGDFSMLSSGIQLTAGPGSVGRGPRGDGFTFFLANQSLPHLNDMPRVEELKGGGLGIGRVDKNITTLTTEYQFVAVEFDTFSNAWDPRDPHVGVNVDSMQSDIAARWLLGSTEENSSYEYDCSIEYDSGDNFLKVNFTEYAIDQERVTHHFSYHIDLRQYLEEWIIVGISASTGDESEEQHILTSWSFNKSLPSNVNHGNIIKSMDKLLLQGMGIGLGLCGGLSGLGYILSRKSKKRKEEEPVSETNSDLKMDDDFQMGIGPKKIPRLIHLPETTDELFFTVSSS
ncbi:hypothetical protein RJT34_04240 [Clitoria ternatea]|uniref:Legume lectin domain-containing protein n=1 Tax=Clitoria ternatea TaxID=43366 RepID=A0AAN9Q386_CLITE